MTRYILLNPDDIHRDGDEMLVSFHAGWIPVPAMHIGDPVGESDYPCRRIPNTEDIRALRASIKTITKTTA